MRRFPRFRELVIALLVIGAWWGVVHLVQALCCR